MVLLLGTSVLTSPAGADGIKSWSGDVRTERPIELAGNLDAIGGSGALASWHEGGAVHLSAERIHIWTETSEGERVVLPGGAQTWHQLDYDNQRRSFGQARIAFSAWTSPAQILVEPVPSYHPTAGSAGRGAAELSTSRDASASGRGAFTLETVPPGTSLAWAGATGQGQGVDENEFPAYRYTVQAPRAGVHGADLLHVEGDFTLFVNNLTLAVHPIEGERWSTWAGFRTQTPADGGPGAPVEDYELRIVRLAVENATLSIEAKDAITLLGEQLALATTGTVELAGATGRIASPEQALLLDRSRALFLGTMESVAGPLEDGVSGERGASGAGTSGLGLSLEGEAELVDAAGARSVAVDRASSPLFGGSSLWIWLVPVGVVLVGSVAVGLRHPALLRPLPRRWRQWVFDRWEDAGLEREMRGQYARAASVYRRMAKLDPEHPMGWYLLARAQLEDGRSMDGIETVQQAREQLEVTPLDLLELRVAGLAHTRNHDQIGPALDEIAERGPRQARSLVEDLRLDEVVDLEGKAWWRNASRGYGMDGYV